MQLRPPNKQVYRLIRTLTHCYMFTAASYNAEPQTGNQPNCRERERRYVIMPLLLSQRNFIYSMFS